MAEAQTEATCVYDEPWQGECGDPAVREDPALCEDHADKTCWCGLPATGGCLVASSLVCGRPTCDDHKCNRTGSGFPGSGAHSEEGRTQYQKWKQAQENEEESPDLGELDDLVREAAEGEIPARELHGHMSQISEQIEEFTDGARTGNIVYAQSHVLEKAVELLREYYREQEVKGQREAEAMATAIILESESEEEVM